jgi:hypothetical protein
MFYYTCLIPNNSTFCICWYRYVTLNWVKRAKSAEAKRLDFTNRVSYGTSFLFRIHVYLVSTVTWTGDCSLLALNYWKNISYSYQKNLFRLIIVYINMASIEEVCDLTYRQTRRISWTKYTFNVITLVKKHSKIQYSCEQDCYQKIFDNSSACKKQVQNTNG